MLVEDLLEQMSAKEFAEWGLILFPPEQRTDSTEAIETQLRAQFGVVRKEKWQPH